MYPFFLTTWAVHNRFIRWHRYFIMRLINDKLWNKLSFLINENKNNQKNPLNMVGVMFGTSDY